MTWLFAHAPVLGVFVALVLAGFGVPLPEDLTLLTAGYLCWHGDARLAVMLPVSYAGILIGDSALYWIGWSFGPRLMRSRWVLRLVGKHRLERAAALFQKHGAKIVLLARHASGARVAFFLTAGVMRMSFVRFLFFDAISSVGSVALWILVGRHFGAHIDRARLWIKHTEHVVLLAAIILGSGALIGWLIGRRRMRLASG